MDRETLRRAIQEKLRKNKDGNLQNSENITSRTENTTELNKGYKQNVTFVTHNLDSVTREKLKSVTNVTNPPIPPQNPVEFSSEEEKETEEENIEIKDNMIIIKGKNRTRFEVYYGFAGTVEDSTRIINLKIPQLPQFELVAKKKDETLNLVVAIDFYHTEGKTIYYIRNKKEIIEKLYAFRGNRNISKRLINEALDIWLEKINPEKYIQWIDVREVVKKYPEWEEINQDPLGFFVSRSSEVLGNEKLKIAVIMSVVSSQLRALPGIYRVHLILSGPSGAGKSSTIKSILKLFYDMTDGVDDWVVLSMTRMTENALGYLNVDTLDGKILFIEQLDNVQGVNYLRESLSEGRITTFVTVKDPETGDLKTVTKVIYGQPAFIATNVVSNIDHQIVNRTFQLYLPPAEDRDFMEKVVRAIISRRPLDDKELQRVKLVTYVWLKSRPSDPIITPKVEDVLVSLVLKFINERNVKRATEITRNLVRAAASLFGHEEVKEEDVDFVMKYFKKDIILTTLELSERDLQLLKWLRDHGFVEAEKEEETRDATTSEIAQYIKMSTVETKKLLDSLYDKGLLWKAYDGKKFSWALSRYGLKVLAELEEEIEGEKQEIHADIEVDDQLLAIISSKLLGKETVTDEELRGILERVAQATDLQAQDLLIKVLEAKGIIKSTGEGVWKVL
ncbi:hypothetical protein [Sulfurisphaera ohwakuensis]|uniref:hypothetical protein n=1 Tax=Sulfurisphaera ohwakuensis TaxID=69656 RepID=UPI0036F1A812